MVRIQIQSRNRLYKWTRRPMARSNVSQAVIFGYHRKRFEESFGECRLSPGAFRNAKNA